MTTPLRIPIKPGCPQCQALIDAEVEAAKDPCVPYTTEFFNVGPDDPDPCVVSEMVNEYWQLVGDD